MITLFIGIIFVLGGVLSSFNINTQKLFIFDTNRVDAVMVCMVRSLSFLTFSHFIDWMYWDRSGPKKVEETLDLILQQIKSLSERIGTLESASQPSSHPTPQYPTWGDAGIGADQCHRRDTTAESFHCAVGSHSAPTATVDAEFQRLRNTVQSVRLPPNLTLQEPRQGVKREDLPLFNVLAKSDNSVQGPPLWLM